MSNGHALGALIDQAKKANGWSDQTIADRAAGRGHIISKSNIARIRTEPVATIVGKQLFALEAGLGIPVRQLARAALDSMGVPGYSTTEVDAEQAISADPTLPDHVRRTLLTIIRTERVSREEPTHESAVQDPPQPRTPSEAERKKQEINPPALTEKNKGQGVDSADDPKTAANIAAGRLGRKLQDDVLGQDRKRG